MAATYTSPFALAGYQTHLGPPSVHLPGMEQDVIFRLMDSSEYRAVRSARRRTMRGGPTELDDLFKQDDDDVALTHFATQCIVTVRTGSASLGQEKQW